MRSANDECRFGWRRYFNENILNSVLTYYGASVFNETKLDEEWEILRIEFYYKNSLNRN